MNRLKDKVAVVTGGAAGIGKETAKVFLLEGAKALLVDIDEEALKKTVKEFDNANVKYCQADVSKASDVKKYTQEALDVFGRIDVFFSNAGIEGTSRPIAEYPDEVFNKVIDINLKGVWHGCKYVIPKMAEGGSVIITSSVAGLKGFQGLGAYVASKHGVIGIMRTAAIEFAERKIRVNTVHPGPVNNEMMRRIEADISPDDPLQAQQGFEAIVPFGRYAEASEIADLVIFLASDESKYITGSTHVIDGGLMAG
ncbi:SDR family NAD(P)-dependent oxidoreductase [Flagellimonas lutaonensis]|uniref:3-oxoacyl-(Acyl-carrier-protein) reductase n=1 Tax=Flagellimonas lutaonensis TaxID=516051 RepID=A0A0D5YQT0_9FLAO|nr:SDR family NAD(P)-dependent oxidoreductase [Allomuricauda lutaonensis]AKA34248.1 3-oxoacyl-(Acyl-carrier-protein) reductase [Allomuricauda lutaonensis]